MILVSVLFSMDNFLKEYSCLLKMWEILWLDTARTMATRSCWSIHLSSATSLDSGWQKLVDFCLLQEITSVVTPTSFTIFDIKGHSLSCISYQKQAFFFSSSSKTIKALKLCFHQDITQPMIKFWRIPKYLANTIHQYAQLLPPCLHPVSSQTLQTLLRQAMCTVQGVSKKELSEIKKLSEKDWYVAKVEVLEVFDVSSQKALCYTLYWVYFCLGQCWLGIYSVPVCGLDPWVTLIYRQKQNDLPLRWTV